jgi:hypothetical protein
MAYRWPFLSGYVFYPEPKKKKSQWQRTKEALDASKQTHKKGQHAKKSAPVAARL